MHAATHLHGVDVVREHILVREQEHNSCTRCRCRARTQTEHLDRYRYRCICTDLQVRNINIHVQIYRYVISMFRGKRDLIQRQKRPAIEPKETYYMYRSIGTQTYRYIDIFRYIGRHIDIQTDIQVYSQRYTHRHMHRYADTQRYLDT